MLVAYLNFGLLFPLYRSEERRVGKECIQLEFDFGIMETIDQSLNMRQA